MHSKWICFTLYDIFKNIVHDRFLSLWVYKDNKREFLSAGFKQFMKKWIRVYDGFKHFTPKIWNNYEFKKR